MSTVPTIRMESGHPPIFERLLNARYTLDGPYSRPVYPWGSAPVDLAVHLLAVDYAAKYERTLHGN